MLARVKVDCPFSTITACSGVTFTKHAWTSVSVFFADEVARSPYLEIETQVPMETDSTLEEVAPELPAEAQKPTRRGKR